MRLHFDFADISELEKMIEGLGYVKKESVKDKKEEESDDVKYEQIDLDEYLKKNTTVTVNCPYGFINCPFNKQTITSPTYPYTPVIYSNGDLTKKYTTTSCSCNDCGCEVEAKMRPTDIDKVDVNIESINTDK